MESWSSSIEAVRTLHGFDASRLMPAFDMKMSRWLSRALMYAATAEIPDFVVKSLANLEMTVKTHA